MSQVDLPAVARRRVRLALRSAREAKQLTQTEIARAMDWSLSKVMRIEKGEVNVSSSDLKLLLEHLEVRDPDHVRQLLDDARLSRQQRWAIDQADRDHLTPAMLELIQYEAEATAIRYFASVLIPGPLQTRRYAEAIFSARSVGHLRPDTIAARVSLRQRRVQRLYRDPRPDCLVILDESVLMRPLGGPEVMAEQLDYLISLMDETGLEVRVLPFAAPASEFTYVGPFVLLDLEEGVSALLYRERMDVDEVVHADAELALHRSMFDWMWAGARDCDASRTMIAQRVKQLRTD
jgi:transcriptional regulator with XRE-family HTH domain